MCCVLCVCLYSYSIHLPDNLFCCCCCWLLRSCILKRHFGWRFLMSEIILIECVLRDRIPFLFFFSSQFFFCLLQLVVGFAVYYRRYSPHTVLHYSIPNHGKWLIEKTEMEEEKKTQQQQTATARWPRRDIFGRNFSEHLFTMLLKSCYVTTWSDPIQSAYSIFRKRNVLAFLWKKFVWSRFGFSIGFLYSEMRQSV